MSLQPGTRFGRYALAELLGKGGMGEVYRAHDTVLHRPVALKILQPRAEDMSTGQSATDGAARMLREARAAAGLVHPNAIAIYDVGELDGVPFLAMELVEGRTLRAFIGDSTVPLGRRIRWLTDVARALASAHELGLVHRDIKPENVMVRDDGAAKVLDFGIARRTTVGAGDPNAATAAATLGTLTAQGVVVGTPMYMAPEQMRGETVDGRADQFAWGVLAYELLTGAVPWRAESGVQLVATILTGDPAPLSEKNPEVPPEVDSAVRVALNKLPRDRYASMNDLADDIEPFSTATASTARSSRKRSIPATSQTSGDVALAPTEQLSVGSRRPVPVSARNELSTRSQLVTAGGRVSGPPKPRSWPGIAVGVRVAVGAGLALAALATIVALRALPARSGSSVVQDAAPSEAQTQMSASTEATGEFRAGMLALRDATVGTARTHFDRALKIDPAFAAAHLGRALFETISDGTVMVDLQEHLAGARSGRAALGDRDRALLTALEPCALAPPDFKESVRRLEEAAKKYPDDANLVFELGFFRRQLGDHEGAVKAFQEALARDPTFATAWRMIAHERIAMDDISGAVQADQECLKIAPSGIACFADLAGIRSHEGKCDGVVEVSRRMLAAMPESDDAYMYLAGGLFGVGEPLGAVRSAFELRWQRVPPDHRRVIEAEDNASLDILAGDFAQAFTHNAEIDAAVASDAQEWGHFRGAYLRMLLNVELGKPAEAVATARDYMTRRSAWSGSSFESGLTMWVQSLEFAAGGIQAPEFEKLRERWASEPNAVGDRSPGSVWAVAYAGPVQTKDDAARALAAMPTGPLLDIRAQTPDMLQRIGHAYLLGGRLDDAIAALGDAARSCKATRRFEPIFTTWAIYDLGQAFEARGDHDQACDAYTRVLARWGGTRSSLTASKARARVRALRCGGGDSSAAGLR